MRPAKLLAVAVLAIVVAALPIQSAFAIPTLSLAVAPTSVVQGGLITFAGNENPISSGSPITIYVYYGSICTGTAFSYSTVEGSSGNYQSINLVDPAIYPAGQYCAISKNAVTQIDSDPVTFTVSSPATPMYPYEISIMLSGGGTATFATSSGGFSSIIEVPTSSVGGAPLSGYFPFGFFSFEIVGVVPGGTVTITMTFPDALPADTVWVKVEGSTYSIIPVSVVGNTLTLTLTDDDSDGVISDPGAPGVACGPLYGRYGEAYFFYLDGQSGEIMARVFWLGGHLDVPLDQLQQGRYEWGSCPA